MKIKDYFLTKEDFEVSESSYEGVLETKNVPNDLEQYYNSPKYISHTKDKSSKSKIYQLVQRRNEKYKLKIISRYKPSGSLLDYGCGDGSFLKFISNHNYTAYGFEPNQKAKDIAVSKIGQANMFSSLDEIEDRSLDVITLWHVLEHVPNPIEIVSKLKKKLKKDGFLFIALPNYQSFDAKFYKEHWAAWDTPRHIFHYSREGGINFFFNQCKSNVLNTYPLPFDSYYISLISENYSKNPLGILRAPFVAFLSNLIGNRNGNYSSVIYVFR